MTNLLSNVISSLTPNIILQDEAIVEKIVYYKKEKKLKIILIPDKIIDISKLDTLESSIKQNVPYLNDIFFKTIYKNHSKNLQDIMISFWENILYELNKRFPSCQAWLKDTTFKIDNTSIFISVNSQLGIDSLKAKNTESIIGNLIRENFEIEAKVFFELKENAVEENYENYLIEKENETKELIKDIISDTEKKSPQKNGIAKPGNSKVLKGKSISSESIFISEVSEESGTATIQGEIFDVETRELKSGKVLLTISVTDYKSSIGAKVFGKSEEIETLLEVLKCGKFIKLRGEARYDTFSKELVIYPNDINAISPEYRMDFSETKRVELHAHTNMSAMDGISSTTNIIQKASQWGHPAIAITDHGVVQAFPEAMSASKKFGIKVIYGVEGYLVNDGEPIVLNCSGEDVNGNYIVFDLETTGLSSRYNKITEIGAVKISNGTIVDRFHKLVNPQTPIPPKIVELTGITDEMVENEPTIDEILPSFLEFIGNDPVVAHNASFDTSFVIESCNRLNLSFNNPILDTLSLAKVLLPSLKRYKLNNIAKELRVELLNHHRAVDDAVALAKIFMKFIKMLDEKGIEKLDEINDLFIQNIDVKKLDTFHIIILVKNQEGLKNLYKIISHSHLDYFYKKPRIPKSLINKYREGLIIGTACEAGELYKAVLKNKEDKDIEKIIKFYDYLEIQPIENNYFLLEKKLVNSEEDLREINKKIISLGKKYNKPVVATGDVHFTEPQDEAYRRILMAGQGYSDADNQAPLYFKTTDEMLAEFRYLGEDTAYEVVVNNPNLISQMVESVIPIPEETFPPKIEGSEQSLREMCNTKARSIYGDPLPEVVEKRLERELNSIISNGYAVMYIIAQKLVTKSLEDGYLVGSRGSVGSSFVATMSDITEVNPLPPHYVCPSCKHSEFILDGSIPSGADLPDKSCSKCNTVYIKDGHDIPFEVFLGFEGDKEPDIDLNFAGEYQAVAHKYTEELFGKGYVFRAGTIGTIADKTAFGFVKKYSEEKQIIINNREVLRLSKGCTGVKRTTGQHPGGVMVVPDYTDIFEFTPIQYPANDGRSGVITTHFDYHSISGRLLKLDILGHDVPTIIRMLQDLTGVDPTNIQLDDGETMKIFTGPEPLNIVDKDFKCEVGTLGIPEFGTKFVRQMLMDTMPTTFGELVRISGLSHGTDVWINNAQELVRQKVAELKDVISTRDDIMNYLIYKNLEPKLAFKIMEKVRKGKGLTSEDEEIMKKNNVPRWYIDSCNKIKYMFPKAHAAAYVMMSFRIAFFKVHYPLAFYATYFTTKASDFDADLVIKGKSNVNNKMKELENLGNNATQKEKDLYTVLEVVMEMYCRGLNFSKVDIYESSADRFTIKDETLLPPLTGLQGVGENAAKSIENARENGSFMSIEDLRQRTKINKTAIEALQNHGCLNGLSQTNQLSLF